MSAPRPQQDRGNRSGGLDYRSVNERIQEFYQKFPEGRIITNPVELLCNVEAGVFAMRAELFRNHEDAQPFATGTAIEVSGEGYVNKQGFALENAESSAIGRALQNSGIVTKKSEYRPGEVARIERVEEAEAARKQPAPNPTGMITGEQKAAIEKIAKLKNVSPKTECQRVHKKGIDELTNTEAADFITGLQSL